MTPRSNLMLVDDHLLMRKGLRGLLDQEDDFNVIGEAGTGREAIELARQLKPDIVIMDINMPDINGIGATRQILSDVPGCMVLALSMHAGKMFVEEMLAAGAAGYLLKESAPEELLTALKALQSGKSYLSVDITDIVLSKFRQESAAAADPDSPGEQMMASKLCRPDLPVQFVHRGTLIHQLNKGLDKKLTLIVAPTGYGKSTLANEWMNQSYLPSSWLSLGKEDINLGQFLKCLIAAVRKLHPDAGKHLLPMLEVANLPPVSILAGALLADLEQISSRFILVIDNFHFAKEKSVQDLLSQVLMAPIKFMHLVLIDRKSPFLPLTALRANNGLSEIRIQDLQFTLEEVTIFLEQALGKSIDPETATAWFARTEGWVTGLLLAIHSFEVSGEQEISKNRDKDVSWRELMTNREYEILLLLEERLRDKEIADRLCVSTETVKSHLKNLYGKLYAKNRRDAIVKARELGFFP